MADGHAGRYVATRDRYCADVDAPAAILLDVYETVLSCDFERHFRELADSAGSNSPNGRPRSNHLFLRSSGAT